MRFTKNDWMAIGVLDYILAEAIENKYELRFDCPITIEPCEMPRSRKSKEEDDEFNGDFIITYKTWENGHI